MLRDRRLLLEQELRRAHDTASTLYLNIVTTDGDVNDPAYHAIRNRISDLQFDLNVVNQLIHKGHE
jgi:hypothetical protein